MKKHVMAMLSCVAVLTVLTGISAEVAGMEPIEATVPDGGEVTPLPSSTDLSPGATITNEWVPETETSEEDTYGWVPDVVSEYAMEYGTIVIVDIASQHVYMCVDGAVIADADCVSGDLYNSPTPTGLYSVWYMVRGLYMMGTYYTEYAAFFNGDIALHDADAWRSEYGGTIYQGGGSHGCINLPRWFAEIVYNNIWEGTPVYVF